MNKPLEYAIANMDSIMKGLLYKADTLEDAEDIYQILCEKFLRSNPTDVTADDAAFYVVRALRSATADFYRKVNRAEVSLEDFTVEDDDGNTSTEVPYTFDQLHQYQIDMASDPSSLIEREEEMGGVIAKINDVSNADHRGVLRLVVVDQLPSKVVAELTHRSWCSVRKIIQRFRAKHIGDTDG